MRPLYSILMPYYNRAGQLHNTLTSFVHHYSNRRDYEVLILIDKKESEEGVQEVFKIVNGFGKVLLSDINIHSPGLKFNMLASRARGSRLVLQSPEVFHMSDVLGACDKEFMRDPNAYVVCACESSAFNSEYIKSFADFEYRHHMWYQHSKHRNYKYHFCTVILRENFFRIGGFDRDYAEGLAYDDNDFIDCVEQDSKLKVIVRDDVLTVHQKHVREHQKLPNYKALLDRNKKLYDTKREQREGSHVKGSMRS
ncbi:hypothetical protein LCGC14_0717610 [marine sediment metagenome]|uniref:Glycosyltransferase 2-like domain-containing protein n=1 Tax=marine sediment metagenome TaxID=412755 RepID=A0A0F9SYP1_9ZZZZ